MKDKFLKVIGWVLKATRFVRRLLTGKRGKDVAAGLLLLVLAGVASAEFVTTSNPVHTSGKRATVDVPVELHMRNIGGSDGAGLCVGTSNEVAGRWQSIPELDGFQKWLARRPGGSYPEMLASDLKTFMAAKGVALPKHIQHTGGDIEFLRLAVKTRRMVSITYAGCDPFYGSTQGIAHMVDCAHLDGSLGAIIDNNEPTRWRWMKDGQLVNRWLGRADNGQAILIRTNRGWMEVGGGWMVVWLASPPPPVDTTAKDYLPERPTVVHPDDGEPTPVPLPGVFTGPLPPELDDPLAPVENPLLLNGVNSDKLKPRMRYWVNGEEVDRSKAIEILRVSAGDSLEDDSGLPFISVVSDDPAVAKLVQDALRQYAGKLHVGVFKSDSWVAKQRLTNRVTAQLPATSGGRTVFKSDTISAEELVRAAKAALGIVDPPPAPPTPEPKPAPPTPPEPKPAPKPDEPAAPSEPSSRNALWLLVALIVAWMITRRTA